MTTWAVPGIAQFCRQAGWRDDDLIDAVAVALAASGGQDHYRFNPGHLAATERRGLFALLSSEASIPEGTDLFSPSVSAQAARGKWASNDQSWSWHLAWISGEAQKHIDYVTASLASADPHKTPAPPGSFNDHLQNIRVRTDAMQRAASDLGRPNV